MCKIIKYRNILFKVEKSRHQWTESDMVYKIYLLLKNTVPK